MPTLKPEYGPSLVQLLAPRPLPVRIAAGIAGVLLLIAIVGVALAARPDERQVLVRGPVTFNFVHGPQWERVQRPGALVALRHADGDLFLDSFVVRDLMLPPYRGAVGGMLPVYADRYLAGQRTRYAGYEFVGEGRSRINNGIGYQVTFKAKRGERTLYVRHLLLVEEEPEGRRHGVVIELQSTAKAGTPNADGIGTAGALKMALRSFRFGDDREGGTA